MPLSKYFRLEALTLIAFLATIPIYSPNHLLFETGVFDVPTFMAPFANTMLFSTLVLGTLAALASGRRCPERLLGRGWVVAGVAAYLTGYGLLIAAAALPGVGTGAVGALSGFLLAAGTVELAVLWGSYMAAYDLRQALLWCALSVGCAALVGLLLSSTTFGVGLIVFVVLVLASFPVPCLAAWKRPRGGARPGDLGGGAKAAGAASSVQEAAESPAPTRRARLASLASVSGMPLAGLMVFAFMMGARKFILFDVVNMELLGCALGAVVALPICLLRTSRPLTTLIYRMLVPAFALVLIVLNSFPGTDADILRRVAHLRVLRGVASRPGEPGNRGPCPSSLPARCSARRWRPSRNSRFWAWVRAHRPFRKRAAAGALGETFYWGSSRRRSGAFGAGARSAQPTTAGRAGCRRGGRRAGPKRAGAAAWPTRPA
ncbi:MAG: hypothetical protein ACLUVF_08810 [Adlercreutzia sp.]